MDPSHVPTHSNADIERAAILTLNSTFPLALSIPIDIDLVAEKHPMIETLRLLTDMKKRFNVEAALIAKTNSKCDIFLDDNTNSFYRRRANFSIAHEVGHVILHPSLYENCTTIEDSIELSRRIKQYYKRIEREANIFAGAILIPRKTIFKDTNKIYEGMLKGLAGDLGWEDVISMLKSTLSNRYQVSAITMEIRLKNLNIINKLYNTISQKLDFIDWN
ncbi:hypothetical protein ES705_22230 [subsurface metagenome]